MEPPDFRKAQRRRRERNPERGPTVPKPKQLPYPPLFTTLSQSPETINWSARIGASVVTLAADLDIVRWVFGTYVDEAAKHGRTVRSGQYSTKSGMVLCRNVAVGRTHEEAMETARQVSAFWTHWLGEFGFFEALRMKGQEGPVPKTFEQMLKSGFQIVGTPDEVGEEISAPQGHAQRRLHHLHYVCWNQPSISACWKASGCSAKKSYPNSRMHRADRDR